MPSNKETKPNQQGDCHSVAELDETKELDLFFFFLH